MKRWAAVILVENFFEELKAKVVIYLKKMGNRAQAFA